MQQQDRDDTRRERQPTTYVVEVGLADGRTLRDEVGTPISFGQLHRRLYSELFVALTERLVFRSDEVRFVRIHKAEK